MTDDVRLTEAEWKRINDSLMRLVHHNRRYETAPTTLAGREAWYESHREKKGAVRRVVEAILRERLAAMGRVPPREVVDIGGGNARTVAQSRGVASDRGLGCYLAARLSTLEAKP